jgi:hypothetical protein
MITSRNNRFLKGGFCRLLIAAAVFCGAFAAQAAGTLPAGYTELEYIESSGTQYINTGIVPKTTTRVFCDFQYTATSGQCGWGSTGSKESFFFGVAGDGTFKATVSGNFTVSPTGVAVDTDRHTFDISMSALKLDGTAFANATTSPFSNAASGNTLYLFALHAGWSPYVVNYASMRIYSCKIYDGETLVRDFVPVVRASDSKAGLYDLETDAFFGNAGSGSFTAGPEGPFYKILPIPDQKYPSGATPEPGFTITNTETGASWTFAEGGAAPGGCPFEASYSHADGVGTVTATGKAGSDYAGVTVSRSYSVTDELLVNGGFEDVIDYDSGNKVGLALNWTPSNGYGNNACASNSGYSPNQTTTFISGTYCAVIDVNRSLSQVFTNDVACVATLSWKCKHRTNINSGKAMFYWVLIDGEVVYPEEKTTGSDVRNRSVSGIVLASGEHTLTFQGHSEDNVNQALFVDNVSLKVQSVSSLVILPIEDQIGTGSALTPSFVVSNTIGHATYEVGGGASSELFDVVYSNNTARGTATVTVTGKAGSIYEGETTFREFRIRDYTLVRATASGTGDGSSWASPISWASALAAAAADEDIYEIWLQGDVAVSAAPAVIAFSGRTIVRGGFAGTESSADERSGAHSVFSANDAYDILIPNVAGGASLEFDRVDFTKAKLRAVVKSGGGDISFTNCAFLANGNTIGHNSQNADGNGFKASGGGSTAKFFNCRFEGNGPRSSTQQAPGGCAIRADGLSRLALDGCTFLTNGVVAWSQNADVAAFRGHTMYLTGTPLTMLNTRVSGSMGFAKDTGVGGSVWLGGDCGGSVISNCVFSGNVDRFKDQYGGSGGGTLVLSLGSSDQRVDIIDSTFAYNFTHSRDYGCLAVVKGDVHVTGSKFFDNILGYGNARGYGADIAVGADGRLAIGHSHLTTLTDASITSVDPANLTIDMASMTSGNPYLTTSVLDFEALLSYDSANYASGGSRNMDITTSCASLVGIDPTPLAVKPVKPDVGAGNVIYVAADAAGTGDGSSWANAFTDLSSAIAVASANKNEIWVKGNLTPAADAVIALLETDLAVYGGFAGTEASAAERAPGAMTTINGTEKYDLVKVSVFAGCSLSFDGFNFTKAIYRAVAKRGAGDLKFTNCRFVGNGFKQSAHGRGICSLGGQGAAKLVVENCVFEGNKQNGRVGNSGCGAAVYAMSQRRFFCDNTLVCSNGVVLLNGSLNSPGVADNRSVRGSAMFLYATPTTMRNTRIAANGGSSRESNVTGGIVFLMGYSDGSAFTNCAFVGNWANNYKDGQSCNTCGALVFRPSAASHTLDLENCTFAYNVSQANQSPGGLNVLTGDVRIHNSIFWRNLHGYYSQGGYANDIEAKAGSVSISHSMVTGTDVDSIRGAAVDTVTIADTVYVADPELVTSYESFSNHLNYATDANYIQRGTGFDFAYLESIDAHLLSAAGYWTNDGTEQPGSAKTSTAIDKGDPDSAYANEPSPNGGRVNLGAYGNTAQASMSPSGQPSVESFSIAYPGGYTRPQAELTLGLASGTAYFATVTIVCKTNGVVVGSKTFESCQTGDVVTMMPPYYFPAGTGLTFEYTVSASGATPCADSAGSVAQGTLPPFYGKGGGANVIHVREGADCLMNGSDWTDAYPDVESALAAVGSGKTEIWIAKATTSANGAFTLSEPLAIRGGFAATENSAAERTGDWNTKFDMLSAKTGLEFTNGAGCPLELDRITITRATNRALKKDGAGALVLNGCAFSTNGLPQTLDGRGIYVSGGCVVAATNCLFEGNYCTSDADTPGAGSGAYITSCAKAVFSNCRFVGNGIRYSQPNSVRTSYSRESAVLYANATPLFCHNVRFAANRANYGGVVALVGNCDGSLLENCAFVGNFIIMHWANGVNSYSAPLCVNMDNAARQATLRNCTFAYNLNSNRQAPAGLLVNKGKVVVEDSIFWGNRRSSHILPESDYPAPEDIYVAANGYLALTNVFIASTYMGTDRRHCLQTADASHLTTNNIVTGDAMLISTTDEVAALMTTGNSSFPDLYYPASAAAALAALNVHLRGGSGYCDENTGALVNAYRWSVGGNSPALDASPRKPILEPDPNGKRVNLGCYGNSPWATMSASSGFFIFVR